MSAYYAHENFSLQVQRDTFAKQIREGLGEFDRRGVMLFAQCVHAQSPSPETEVNEWDKQLEAYVQLKLGDAYRARLLALRQPANPPIAGIPCSHDNPEFLWIDNSEIVRDLITLLTIVAIFVATGVPWFVNGFEPDFGMASWGLLSLGGIYIAFSLMASPSPSRGRWRAHGLTLLDAIGVILIGFVWQHVGALQNPLFLAVFALPVISAIFLSRWHPYSHRGGDVLVVGVVSIDQVAELRWYVSGLIGDDTWLDRIVRTPSAAIPPPSFSGFYAPTSYLVVLLEVFTVASSPAR